MDSRIRHLGIRTKLLLITGLFAGTIAALAGMFGVAFSGARVNGPMYREVIQGKDLIADILPPPMYIIEAYLSVNLLAGDPEESERSRLIERLTALQHDFNDRVAHWQIHLPEGALRQRLLDEVVPPAQEFFELVGTTFLPSLQSESGESVTTIVGVRLKPLYDTHRRAVDELANAAGRANEQCELRAAEYVAGWTWAMTVFGVAGVLLTVAINGLIAFSLSRRLNSTTALMRDISEGDGDLTKRLLVTTEDEIGEMATYFNSFVEKLQDMIATLATSVNTVASSSTELSATASQLASGAEETTNQSAQVASAAERMSSTMHTMAASSEQMSTNVKSVSAAIEQVTASISEMAKSAERAATGAAAANRLVESGNSQIGQLGGAADEIGKVIEVIQDIAEQTNLLALNATIESARAGEAGKGFAVVATEVKELAKQTAGATEDIRRRIEGIQGSARQAVQAMEGIGDVIRQVNDLSRVIASAVEEQSITTKEIARHMAQSSTAAQTVAHSVAESARASQEIARIVVDVDQAARQSAQGAAQTQTTGSELSRVAEQLRSLVGRFRV